MEKMIAYCGLACDSCPIHLAALEKDIVKKTQMIKDISEQLANIYGTTPKPEIITDCDGCKMINGRLFTGCIDCEVRKCANMKDLENCAYCSEFACEKLVKHYTYDPASRDRLEVIRKSISN